MTWNDSTMLIDCPAKPCIGTCIFKYCPILYNKFWYGYRCMNKPYSNSHCERNAWNHSELVLIVTGTVTDVPQTSPHP